MNLKNIKKIFSILLCVLLLTMFGGCQSEDPVEAKFKKDLNSFSNDVYEISTQINALQNTNEDNIGQSTYTLLANLDKLRDTFKVLANMNYPENYAYLKDVAKEASDYMNVAVDYYHQAYEGGYDPAMEEYAQENYQRACTRMQFILATVRGEDTSTIAIPTPSKEVNESSSESSAENATDTTTDFTTETTAENPADITTEN